MIGSVVDHANRTRQRRGQDPLEDAAQESFIRLGAIATAAVARWLAGESIDAASAAGEEFSRVFAQLAASSNVPLGEVVMRCRYWRDACQLVLHEAAAELHASEEALTVACAAIQGAVDHALAQTSALFDAEHQRTQAELAHRQQELAFLATHDPLTKVANRSLIMDRLKRMLVRSARHGGMVAVFFIDLDDFKVINDTQGHTIGDRLLIAVAERLRGLVRDNDTLGRLGGDEFVLIGEGYTLKRAPARLAERLLGAFADPFPMQEPSGPVKIRASVGVAIGQPGSSAEQLLCDADIAMYSAQSRRSGCETFEDGMQQVLVQHSDRRRLSSA
ncbi:MAG TPA: GGDEF domain-containing protein [Solirubrobacteraceae bacterium]|jgi:diguanylate cyclase (GGDEF)-like protein